MKALICGGGGFIGQHLARYLLAQGFEIVILDRNEARMSSPKLQWYQVDLLKSALFEKNWFSGVDAVINLSGKDFFTFWNQKARKAIWDSRVTVNRNLIEFISKLDKKPRVFVSASAIGYYGDKGDTELDEGASRGQGFLADVCVAWEKEALEAERLGLRSVQIRTAPVLKENCWILNQVLKSFKFKIAFTFGSGKNWFSWIHMDDMVRIYHFVIIHESISGPVNACSLQPVSFRDFVRHLSSFRKALFVIPFPVFILKLVLRETADVMLFSQKMIPAKLLKSSFKFSYPMLEDALKKIFSKL